MFVSAATQCYRYRARGSDFFEIGERLILEYTVVWLGRGDAQGLLVRCGLHDVFGERVLFAERIRSAGIIERYRAHISDRIYEALTGIGYFLNTFAIRFSGTTF